jgi:hypothetical protein
MVVGGRGDAVVEHRGCIERDVTTYHASWRLSDSGQLSSFCDFDADILAVQIPTGATTGLGSDG